MSAVLCGLKYGQHEMATGYLIAVKRFVDSSATGISEETRHQFRPIRLSRSQMCGFPHLAQLN